MPSDFVQRQIDRLLSEAEDAVGEFDWNRAISAARAILAVDEDNASAVALLKMAEGATGSELASDLPPAPPRSEDTADAPTSFANGRYTVKKFLGEGGKKKVYLAHDKQLDRDIAFALIKTEGLDEAGRERITREAQSMGRLGAHPHIVTVFEYGDERGAPFLVTELMGGGDVEGILDDAPDNKLPIEQTLEIARATCRGQESVPPFRERKEIRSFAV